MKQMSKELPLDVEKFKKLFVNRDDIYSVQDKGGAAYHKVNRPLTLQAIKDHMLGKQTIGLYQLKDNKVKWALIDIDINKNIWRQSNFNLEDWKEKIQKQAAIIQDILRSKGMKSYRENSGFKGEHVWVFFERPIEAQLVKNVFDSLFKTTPLVDPDNMHIEIFPKQSHATEAGPGSLVKAPLGKHQRSNKFSKFIDSIDDVEFVKKSVIEQAINEFDAIFQGCSALRNLRDEGIHSEHLGNDERWVLANIFAYFGEKGKKYIEEAIFSKLSDFDPYITWYQLDRIISKGYLPISCKKIQEKGFCPGPCIPIGDGKTPADFCFRQQGLAAAGNGKIKAVSKMDTLEVRGHCYYDFKNTIPEKLSNFILNLYEQLYIDDGFAETTIFKGHIINEDGVREIEIDAKDFASSEKFAAAIYSALGNSGTYIGDPVRIRHASNKFSQKNRIKIKKIFGYNENFTKFYTPSIMITADGVFPNEELLISLEGENQAEHLDMILLSDDEFKTLKKHIDEDLLTLAEFETTHAVMAHTMLPPIAPFVDVDDRSKYAFFLRGQSGTGKSFLLISMQNFYGNFREDVVTWTSTPYAIQRLGYFYKDALFLVDDFKGSNLSNYTAMLQIMQNYADNTARSRLLSSGQAMAHSWPIQGFMTISGEDLIEGEASNIARMIVVEYTGKKRDFDKGERVKQMRSKYSGFTARYIHYILKQDKEKISEMRRQFLREFLEIIAGQANDIRIARNMAILMTSYCYFAEFMWDSQKAKKNIKRLKTYMKTLLQTAMENTSKEKSSHRFWNLLQEYIASDKLQIVPDTTTYNFSEKKGAVVGFQSGGKTWLIKNVAFNEVQRLLKQSGEPLRHTLNSVYKDLEMDGIIETAKTSPRKLNGKTVRVIEVKFDNVNLVK
jgi:hypothetical protein